ncbi:Hypothetical predicted protein, partial [Cloeon dipterum]
ISNTREWRPK